MNLTYATHEQAAQTLKSAGQTVTLEVVHRPEGEFPISYQGPFNVSWFLWFVWELRENHFTHCR